MRLDSVLALIGLVVALAAFYFPYRAGVRKDKAERIRQVEEDQRQDIADAVNPIKEQLNNMRIERDYWRNLVLNHNKEINSDQVDNT